jgi:hypothetical protein
VTASNWDHLPDTAEESDALVIVLVPEFLFEREKPLAGSR